MVDLAAQAAVGRRTLLGLRGDRRELQFIIGAGELPGTVPAVDELLLTEHFDDFAGGEDPLAASYTPVSIHHRAQEL